MNKLQILYVDDEELNLELFKINFSNKYEVFIAENGYSGLEKLQKNPDIIIVLSDMKMPNMNGIEFIKKAKASFPDKKFFILTGFEITKEINDALNKGLIVKYFRKPFNIKEIETSINEVTV